MSSRKGNRNVGRFYRQQVLSGYERFVQQENEDNHSPQVEQRGTQAPTWDPLKQTCYQILIPVIIEKTSTDGGKHNYKILLVDDINLSVSAYSKRSKKVLEPAFAIPGKTGQQSSSIPMVYGIHEVGHNPFSHPSELAVPEVLARLYSFILGKIDATLRLPVQQQANAAGDDDTGERPKSALAPKSLGTNKKTGRRKAILPEVRAEALPKSSAILDETDREILGGRPGNTTGRLEPMGNDTFDGSALEGGTLEF